MTTRVLLVFMSLLSVACRSSGSPAWLLERARQEAEMAAQSRLVHDFRFTDRRQASGITFVNRVVDDAGKAYKLAHYDHGSGLCAADVDRDGLPDLYFLTQLGTNELWKNRSEERRVEKECRSRWAPYHEKKKGYRTAVPAY